MNAVQGHIVAKQLALRPIEPYEGIPPTDSHADASLLARTIAILNRPLAMVCTRLTVGSRCVTTFASARRVALA